MINLMVEKQIKLNDMTFPTWRTELKLEDWLNALVAEIGEAMESAGYKWWKQGGEDLDNLKVEAIDILHFAISASLSRNEIDEFKDSFETYIKDDSTISTTQSSLRNLATQTSTFYFEESRFAHSLALLFNTLEMSYEEVFKAYMTKNVLNSFRQNNGYKDGSYIKIWGDVEDNVVAGEIAKKLLPNEAFEDILYKSLQEYYNDNVAKASNS
jgi:dimeric dUTPase (all-alpha-NTP-PPase superfamily)